MLTINYKIILAAAMFIIAILSGLWLNKIGRPLNTPVFTLHKFAAVGFIVFTVMYLYNLLITIEYSNPLIVILTITIITILGIVVSGAFLSFEKDLPELLVQIHKYLSIPAVISLVFLVYFLN